MDKYEYQAKLEEINKLVEKEAYMDAVKIADTIEWKRVRSVRTLCMISELYETVGRAEDSKAILYRAYRRSPNSRQILYRLTEVCVQTQEFDDAVEYYTEYVNVSPNDNSKYILKYEIYKGRGSSLEEQIAVLEELKSKEYTEQWAYELAKLYDEAGMADKCIAECDDLALWFHSGKYVVQALELKQKYRPLTREQQTIYDNPSEIVDMETKEEVVEKAVPKLGEEIVKELPKSEKDVIADSIIMDTEKEIAAAVQAPEPQAAEPRTSEEQIPVSGEADQQAPAKDINMVNLQNELANSMKEILAGVRPAPSVPELEMPQTTLRNQKAAETEEPMPQRTNIDDLLTGAAEAVPDAAVPQAQDLKTAAGQVQPDAAKAVPADGSERQPNVITAPTINLEKKIRQEIGDAPLRSYAASAADESLQKSEPAASQKTPSVDPAHAAGETEQTKEPAQPVSEAQQDVPAQDESAASVAESYRHDALDAKERQMLGFWAQIRGMDMQVNQAIIEIMQGVLSGKTSSKGNVLIVGDSGNGRTTLAISIAKILTRCKGLQSAKVAKIYAEDFNKKDIAATVNKMAGGVLIIEEAGDLDENAVAQLSMAMDFKTDSLVVFLEDERRYLQELLARSPQLADKFNVTVNVPMLTNDELVEFGKYYAREKDCVLDNTAVEALYDNIGVMQSPDQPVAIFDVKEIIDKAIRNANRFGVGKLTSSISGKRYDENDRVILKGKNFKKVK